jgi:hypothetical protein
MSIEIGKGLDVEKRNRAVKKAYELLQENMMSLFGEKISLTPEYKTTLNKGKYLRERATLEGDSATADDYKNFRADVEHLREKVKGCLGFTLLHCGFRKSVHGYESISMYDYTNPGPRAPFPWTTRSTITLVSSKEATETKEVEDIFKEGVTEISKKYNLRAKISHIKDESI